MISIKSVSKAHGYDPKPLKAGQALPFSRFFSLNELEIAGLADLTGLFQILRCYDSKIWSVHSHLCSVLPGSSTENLK